MSARAIAVAYDDPDILRLVRFAVQRRGYRVVAAGDGRHALRAILEVWVPSLSGVEVLICMKQSALLDAAPVTDFSATITEDCRSDTTTLVVTVAQGVVPVSTA